MIFRLSAISLWSRTSRDIFSFRKTLLLLSNFAPLSVMFMDTSNIAYQLTGTIPIRRSSHTGRYPVEWNRFNGWNTSIPFDDLPSMINPEQGLLVTAGNAIVPETYKYTIGYDWSPSYRAMHLVELINDAIPMAYDMTHTIRNDMITPLWKYHM
jgi:penicillin amidase